MNIAVCTVAYNESEYIAHHIRLWKPYVAKHLVLVSTKPWNGMPVEDDGTSDIARKEGAEVIIGAWSTEAEQREFGLARLWDYDYVIISDPDEFYTKEDIEKILKTLENPHDRDRYTNEKIPVFIAERMTTYWKNADYIFNPADSNKPIIAVDPKQCLFFDKRQTKPMNGETEMHETMHPINVTCHHFSWVHSDAKIREKIQSYSHSDVIPSDWYERVWKGWAPGSDMLIRPYGMEKSIAVYSPAPEEILSVLPNV